MWSFPGLPCSPGNFSFTWYRAGVDDVLVMIADSVLPPEMVAKPCRTTYFDGGFTVTVW